MNFLWHPRALGSQGKKDIYIFGCSCKEICYRCPITLSNINIILEWHFVEEIKWKYDFEVYK